MRVDTGTPVEVRGDEETATVLLAIGEVRLDFTEDAAHDLVDAVRRELRVLDPSGHACDDCYDTGSRYRPMAPGAVWISDCYCPAARR